MSSVLGVWSFSDNQDAASVNRAKTCSCHRADHSWAYGEIPRSMSQNNRSYPQASKPPATDW